MNIRVGKSEEQFPKDSVGQLSANSLLSLGQLRQPTVGQQSSDRGPTVGRQSAHNIFWELFFAFTDPSMHEIPLTVVLQCIIGRLESYDRQIPIYCFQGKKFLILFYDFLVYLARRLSVMCRQPVGQQLTNSRTWEPLFTIAKGSTKKFVQAPDTKEHVSVIVLYSSSVGCLLQSMSIITGFFPFPAQAKRHRKVPSI